MTEDERTGKKTASVLVNLNFLGLPVGDEYINTVLNGGDHSHEPEYRMMQHVLELPPEHMPREALERYCRVSTDELYIAVIPVTDKIFERLLLPLKSAKRCFSLGEYLATIELCSHVGEMLATLLWRMKSPRLDKEPINEATEKQISGDSFEGMTQYRRTCLLRAFKIVEETDAQRFDQLRKIRRGHFHLWSSDAPNKSEQDAFDAFGTVVALAKNVLQIRVHEGKVVINPIMMEYLRKHGLAPEARSNE